MKLLRLLPFLIISIFIVLLLLATFLSVKSSKDNSAYLSTLRKCESDPGPRKASQFIDLDPTIPDDSQLTFLIKRANGDYELIYSSTDEQIVKYLKTLTENFCFVGSFSPNCMTGHYAGEPPGREPCIVPTPNWNQRISEAYNSLVTGSKPSTLITFTPPTPAIEQMVATSLPPPTLTPVPLSLILADFPLAIGATWKYSAEISYQDPNDYIKLLTWVGTVTERVIDKKTEPDGKIIFSVQEDLDPAPPQLVWRQSGTFSYTVSGDGVFEGTMKVYQYPLENNQKWPAFSDFGYEMLAQRIGEVVTPYGKLDNCYTFIIATNPDTSIKTFCTGIGFVKHSYNHHGTPQIEEFVLSSFTPGQP